MCMADIPGMSELLPRMPCQNHLKGVPHIESLAIRHQVFVKADDPQLC